MVSAIHMPMQQATNAATGEGATSVPDNFTLPIQSESSSDDDDSVEKASGVAHDPEKESTAISAKSTRSRAIDNNDAMKATNGVTATETTTSSTRRPPLQGNRNTRMTSFDIEESPSPTKKRRVHSSEGHVWDGFVRRGARLKGFLEDAMQLAATSHAVSDQEEADTGATTAAAMKQSFSSEHNHAADIAREKTAECMILQKKLKEAEANAAALTAANASLREAASASTERMERTVEALRIAGTNAANARADADAAEACAASMATQLQALNNVVAETKRASQVLYKEHEQVSAGARSIEAKLLQRETELARAQKEQRQWKDEKEEMKKRSVKLQGERKSLENDMTRLTEELHEMKHQADEYAAVEQARKDRSALVEKELREARTMLMDASSSAAETETTAAVLNDTIQGLETENKTLHETIEKLQTKAREENERLNTSLTKSEKEVQSLRVKAASHEEDMQRVRMDKTASEKEVAKLKSKVSTLERRLKDATSYAPPPPEDKQGGEHQPEPLSRASSRGVSFSIPPLTTANTPAATKGKTNRVTPAPKSATCSLCSQAASGMMKSCQCGKPTCPLRAHSTCIAKSNLALPSVSHPGTPALRPPVLLCGSIAHK